LTEWAIETTLRAVPAELGDGASAQFSKLEIKRASTAEQVADALRTMIVRGELEPGAPLREVSMAASIGISRNTMREAIRLLAREGLVTHNMHRGALVTRLTEEDVVDIFRVRRTLEIEAVQASAHASRDQLAPLEATLRRFEQAAEEDSYESIIDSDVEFHERLVGMLGSPRLDRFFRAIQAELRLCLSITDTHDQPDRLIAEHRELYELLAAGRQADCIERMTEHLIQAEALVKDIVRRQNGKETAS
jgi:DNA-binding GntR family transcriptional regulator